MNKISKIGFAEGHPSALQLENTIAVKKKFLEYKPFFWFNKTF